MGENRKAQSSFVDLYSVLDVDSEAETSDLLRRIQHCYSEAQQNLNHSNTQKRLHAQQMFHVYLPQARQVLLNEACRVEYDKQRERVLASARSKEALEKAEAARKAEEARMEQEVHLYSINAALDRTIVCALMATTLLFLVDVIFTSQQGYPFGIPRWAAFSAGIAGVAFGLVWYFHTLRQRMLEQMQHAVHKRNANMLHEKSEQRKRAALTEGAVLLIGLSVLNALDGHFLPGDYPLGSRLAFNFFMALVLTVVFFVGRQVCIHAKHPAKVKNPTLKTRKH